MCKNKIHCFINTSSVRIAKSFIKYQAEYFGYGKDDIDSFIDLFDEYRNIESISVVGALNILSYFCPVFREESDYKLPDICVKNDKVTQVENEAALEEFTENNDPVSGFDFFPLQLKFDDKNEIENTIIQTKKALSDTIGYFNECSSMNKTCLLEFKSIICLMNEFLFNNVTKDIDVYDKVDKDTVEYIIDYAIKFGIE